MATTPSWWEQQLPSQKWQRCLSIDGNKAIPTMPTMPAPWGQWCQHKEGQQWHCNKGNNTIADQGQWHYCYEGNNASLTMARTPANYNSNDAIVMRATITMATMAKMPVHQWQCCHHNEGNDVSLTTRDKGSNASLTTAEMPAHWQLHQRHHDKGDNRHCNMNISYVCVHVCTHPHKYIICLSLRASLQTSQTFAVGKRMTNKPLAPSAPLVLQHLCAEIGVNCLCLDKKAPTTVTLVLQNRVIGACVLDFLAGLAFWAKPLRPNPPNSERKVRTKAFLPIPEWCLAIVYAIGCIRVEVASPWEGERATLAI